MKKITSIILVTILCLNLLVMNVFAASATVTVSGPQSVEKGQAVEVKLNLTATDIYAISGVIKYDANQLKLESTAAGYNGLSVVINKANNKFMVYHEEGKFLVNGTGTIVVLNFTVLEATSGATVSVTFEKLEASDGKSDISVNNAVYSFTIAEPVSSQPDSSEPDSSQPDSTESKPTESKPTESKPTESKPTESKPTESKPTVSKPAVTEPTESETTDTETSEPDSTESEPTEPDEPSEPGAVDDKGEHKFCWWWILIVIAIICCVWHLIVVLRKKKREE